VPAQRGSADADGANASPTWTLVERGSFVFGVCSICGFTSPGRRAHYSAESDLSGHEILSHGPAEVPDMAPSGALEPGSADEVEAPLASGEVASGRERLSAQGRS
jgi:hypothetical protein